MSAPTRLSSPLPGDPEQVRRVSVQLASVEARAGEIESRLRAIESGVGPQVWRGQAADSFGRLLAETGPDLTKLAISYGAASRALATYATELAAAQDAARAAATEASTATEGRDRATADRDSARSEAVRHAAAADDARIRLDPVAAQDAEQRRADALGRETAAGAAVDQAEQALQAAQQKADQAVSDRDTAAARCIRELDAATGAGIDSRNLTQDPTTPGGPSPAARYGAVAREIAGDIGNNVVGDVRDKSVLHGAELAIGGVAGGIAASRVSSLNKEADRLMREHRRAQDRYLASPDAAERRFQNALAQEKFMEADKRKRDADKVGRSVGAKVGLAGVGISALGIGYDVLQGKPLVKAAVSGVGGALAAAQVGALVGTMVPVPVVGTVAGALLGWGVGLLVSGGIDTAYDQLLPKGLKDSIEERARPIENAVIDTLKPIEAGVKRVWDAIF